MQAQIDTNVKQVLIVEDDRDDFFLTQDVLHQVPGQPYRASWCGSYDSARQILRERSFDVALVDYRIGERTGLEFISQVGPLYPNCPMILLTGLRNPDIDRAAQEAGAADYLVKDSLSEELLDRSIRYAIQQAQRASLLNSVLTNSAAGMVALNGQGIPTIWNRRALRALGLQQSASDISRDHVAQALDQLRNGGPLPEHFDTDQGETYDLSVSRVQGGGLIVCFNDVTKRMQAEQLLRQTAADAEAANKAKSSFLATMSHELRTPMNGILGMVRVLQNTEIDEVQASYLDTIKSSSDSLLALINDILDLSKIEAGRMELETVDFDIAPLADDVVRLMAPTAFAKGLELSCFVDPTLPRAMSGDPLRLKQIITNLVGNAIKFTQSGSVTLFVMPEMAKGERYVRFSVVDTGIGIPPDKLGQLFKRFSQVDASTTRKYGGTGLGLALCRELVGLMGGEIWVDSAEGEGSTFSFRLAVPGMNSAVEQLLKLEATSLSAATLLVVSPCRGLVETVAAYMESASGRTVHAASEAEALAALAKDQIKGVLFDRYENGANPEPLIRRLRLPGGTAVTLWSVEEFAKDASQPRPHFDEAFARPFVRETFDKLRQRLLAASEQKRPRPMRQVEQRDGKMLRILMAEDNEPNRRVASAILRSAGYKVEMAGDGAAALARATTGDFDVVLMDINMPVMDGFESTERIRATPGFSHLPIVGLTANAMMSDRQKCLAVGMTDHFAKPVDWDRLLKMLDAMEDEIKTRAKVA